MDGGKCKIGIESTIINLINKPTILRLGGLDISKIEKVLNKKILIKTDSKIKIAPGHLGVAGGQYLDLKYEKKKIPKNKIIEMEIKKTGKLFSFCCAAPAIIKRKEKKEIKFFENIGLNIGLLFQIADDLIDFKGDDRIAGKKTGKDKKKGKATLISLLGYKNSIKYCDKIISDIDKSLMKYGSKSKNMRKTLEYILNRNA